jgi:hypothetical protein
MTVNYKVFLQKMQWILFVLLSLEKVKKTNGQIIVLWQKYTTIY